MNFFKSILSEDPNPHSQSSPENSDDPQITQLKPSSSNPSSPATGAAAGDGGWSFGGLIKTLATQSESVIEIYRRDLKEFGSGLQKETAAFREVAGRAVKDLPAEIDGVLKSTAEIISHGTDSLLDPPPSDHDPDSDTINSRKYSRLEAQLRAIESNVNTYCEEPEDLEDFKKWKMGYVLEEKREENETIRAIYERAVPNVVDDETFWCRYFYRVHKLKQQEDARVNLVKRAISVDMDEELSWDVDDEDDNVDAAEVQKKESKIDETPEVVDEKEENIKPGSISVTPMNEQVLNEEVPKMSKIDETPEVIDEKRENKVESTSATLKEEQVLNEEKIVEVDMKGDNSGSCKDSDVSIVSTQLPEEEDMGWDEIEDVGSDNEKKVTVLSGSPNKADLRKQLSAAEEDEDLTWDIEDDDEPVAKPGAK